MQNIYTPVVSTFHKNDDFLGYCNNYLRQMCEPGNKGIILITLFHHEPSCAMSGGGYSVGALRLRPTLIYFTLEIFFSFPFYVAS